MGRLGRAIVLALAGIVGGLWVAYAVIILLTVAILVFGLLLALGFVSTGVAPMEVAKACIVLLIVGGLLHAAFNAIIRPWR
jgi:hypothetical protein